MNHSCKRTAEKHCNVKVETGTKVCGMFKQLNKHYCAYCLQSVPQTTQLPHLDAKKILRLCWAYSFYVLKLTWPHLHSVFPLAQFSTKQVLLSLPQSKPLNDIGARMNAAPNERDITACEPLYEAPANSPWMCKMFWTAYYQVIGDAAMQVGWCSYTVYCGNLEPQTHMVTNLQSLQRNSKALLSEKFCVLSPSIWRTWCAKLGKIISKICLHCLPTT